MYNYYTDLFWQLNKVLFTVSFLLALFIIVYSAIKEAVMHRHNRNLLLLKMKLEEAVLSEKVTAQDTCRSLFKRVDSLTVMERLRNRDLVLSKEAEEELRLCFTARESAADIARIARRSRNKWRRIQALISLSYSPAPGALEILKDALFSKDEDIAYFAMLSLGQMKNTPAAKILLDFLPGHISSGHKIASFLETFPASIVEEVMELTQGPNPQARFWALKILSKFKPSQHRARIIELTADNSDDVRAAACECLGEIGSPQAKNGLERCLKDNVWFVRMHTIRALHKILGADCIPQVITLIKDENWLVRDSVKRAMADNVDVSLSFIEALLKQDDAAVKKDCVDILEASGYTTAIVNNIFSAQTASMHTSLRLLEALVGSSAHLGLESAISALSAEKQRAVLEIIAGIDKRLAEHIDKKIKGEVVEA